MKKLSVILTAIILCLGIIGCADKGPKNLEEYYDISENRAALLTRLNNENTEAGSPYMNIDFDAEDNMMIYKYTYATPVDADVISKSLAIKLTSDIVAKEVDRLKEDTGFSNINIQYIYYAPDNTEVFNKIYMTD